MLVNNAGGNTDLSGDNSTSDTDPTTADGLATLARQWQANIDANVLSAVLVTAALAPRLADDARVINFSSIASTNPVPNSVVWRSSSGTPVRRLS